MRVSRCICLSSTSGAAPCSSNLAWVLLQILATLDQMKSNIL